MSHLKTIAKKELRAYFLSPVALIFLLIFLGVTLFWFFTMEQFWARNIADIRPLFKVFPVMLIFLVAALTMRLWSEEQKLGTLEILLTLPVKIHQLVLGKFAAGLGLVGIALLLTFHVPIIISTQGDLDWGPVIGGYVATLLLASAYLSIGLFLSSITENQIIALILTVVVCGAFYLVGVDAVAGLFPTAVAEILRSLGTGSRFESIGRGVLDLRDLLYYLSLTVSFLLLNTVALEAKRWSTGTRTRSQRSNAQAMVWLVAANLLALNVWIHGVQFVRADLTQRGEFSVSEVTKTLVRELDSPLLIRGYFSKKTHPLLAPLVPKIRDLMEEYGAISGGQVTIEILDPTGDEEAEKEAGQNYAIRSFPFRVASKYEAGVVNSYFSVLVKYGDQYQVLNFDDLIEVNMSGNEPEVKLRNLEYDLTRAIKRAAYGFQTLEAVFADLKDEVEFTAYITPKTLPDNMKQVPDEVKKVAEELQKTSGGKFKYSIVDPDGNDQRQELFQKFGFRPMAAGLFSNESFYLHLLLRVGDQYERIMPAEGMGEAELKKEIVAAVKRSTPGFLKTIGVVKAKSEQPPQMPGHPPQPGQDIAQQLEEKLRENYTVRGLELDKGRIEGDVDIVLVLQPENLDEKAQFAIDQYLMRGGSVIVLAGKYVLDLQGAQQKGLAVKRTTSGLDDVLAAYGVTVQDTMVMDPQNEKFPIPVVKDLGGFRVQQIQLVNYPYFVDVRREGMDESTPILGGLPGLTMHWTSPLSITTPEWPAGEEAGKREVIELLKSSDGAWTRSVSEVQPDFAQHPGDGFGTGTDTKAHVLAVAVHGKLRSAFADKPSPIYGAEGGEGDRTGRTIKASPESARLVVVGNSSFISDIVLGISRQGGGDRASSNIQFVENLVDWAASDVDLLTIRSRGTFARVLLPSDASERFQLELLSYAIAVVLLGLLVGLTVGARRRMNPITLSKRPAIGTTPKEA